MKFAVLAFENSETLRYLQKKWNEYHFDPAFCLIVEKKKETFLNALIYLRENADTIFVIGGLGWTDADFVRQAVAESAGLALVLNKHAQENLIAYVNRTGWKFPPVYAQEKLLNLPEGCEPFPNLYGLEAGFRLKVLNNELIMIPDLQEEAEGLFENYLLNYLSNLCDGKYRPQYFKIFGLPKTEVEERLKEFKRFKTFSCEVQTDVTNDTKLMFSFSPKVSSNTIDTVFTTVYNKFDKEIYADRDVTLEEMAVDLLKVNRKKLSTAESLTGGMTASAIVDIPGASEVFYEGLVTYTDEAKANRLYVKPQVLAQNTAVSDEVAYEMALGLLSTGKCDYALATTGYAGPQGGTNANPVGTCFISVGNAKAIHVHKHMFSGTRDEIRKKAKNNALFYLIKLLKQANV